MIWYNQICSVQDSGGRWCTAARTTSRPCWAPRPPSSAPSPDSSGVYQEGIQTHNYAHEGGDEQTGIVFISSLLSTFYFLLASSYWSITNTLFNLLLNLNNKRFIALLIKLDNMYRVFVKTVTNKFGLRTIKMHQIKLKSCACFSPLQVILFCSITIDFSFKIEWVRAI